MLISGYRSFRCLSKIQPLGAKKYIRDFVDKIRREVTTGARWPRQHEQTDTWQKPQSTMNVAFTFFGLLKLGVPYRTMQGFPFEFIEGMRARAFILGDRDQSITDDEAQGWDSHWDHIWKNNRLNDEQTESVDIWVSVNAQHEQGTANPVPALEDSTELLKRWVEESNGYVRLLEGHGDGVDTPYQEANAVFEPYRSEQGEVMLPSPKEHFGFTDGIGDPVFEGQYREDEMADKVIGRGKLMPKSKGEAPQWQPLAAGEFVLGHPDESQEIPPTGMPFDFMRNGTFMAYRKLHQNVETFHQVVKKEAEKYAKIMDIDVPQAIEVIYAKMCGRWRDGVPLSVVPEYDDWVKFGIENKLHAEDQGEKDTVENLVTQMKYIRSKEARDFRFGDDTLGYKCPVGSHLRRVNTRDYLDPSNQVGVDENGIQHKNPNANASLNKRRRILRRGLPYGKPLDQNRTDESEQGVIMLIMGASLFRQFEFVQQQWIQYGLDFNQGNNTCPMLGDHRKHKRFTLPTDPKKGKPGYVMSELKTFVECRGGDYFFVPSMTALRMIAMGIVDPT